ncbi:phosphoribosyl-ATP diphosphatase [Ferrovum sp. PN-J185]|uniref:phosphoribosyl-ATP diphosphatase n=1 Tax=Ferrovum sp. PN-J185 TaxID=1356306 RepID=UPI000799BA49|nr:phosphoribosyl-ATP diphosphatase [Ferrovum sp. PN-J185]KXW56045.1 phosphoribosyl-ATP pyrophosphatase [Ferrovum sp. PN-J185]MCC6068243.1 phosphoribosyl-ATP diphosphatase [Ferrovum sp. PN-J185]MDE1892322.1 phosphoribosyl-ATP diphosphatase [Betaproteobacteria bacterium]MDE2056632.1 phosphoribosyl-ATP diphosphatase [Betaproteobacteria bacterium]
MSGYQDVLKRLTETLNARKGSSPDSSYVSSLYHKGINTITRKVGEESLETILAAKDGVKLEVIKESADLCFHLMVLLAYFDLSMDDVLAELARREGISGIDEKASRKGE